MMFGVVSIIKPHPVVELVITAHAPGDRLVWVASIVTIVPVQIERLWPK
jgi:hypothetical protein